MYSKFIEKASKFQESDLEFYTCFSSILLTFQLFLGFSLINVLKHSYGKEDYYLVVIIILSSVTV